MTFLKSKKLITFKNIKKYHTKKDAGKNPASFSIYNVNIIYLNLSYLASCFFLAILSISN